MCLMVHSHAKTLPAPILNEIEPLIGRAFRHLFGCIPGNRLSTILRNAGFCAKRVPHTPSNTAKRKFITEEREREMIRHRHRPGYEPMELSDE